MEEKEQAERKAITSPMVDCDREDWLKARLWTAITMAQQLRNTKTVEADDRQYMYALDGIVHGTAVEIIKMLGMTPEYKNLRRHPMEPPEYKSLKYHPMTPIQCMVCGKIHTGGC